MSPFTRDSDFAPIIKEVIAVCTDATTTFSDIVDNYDGPAERLFRKAQRKGPDTANRFLYWDLMVSFQNGPRLIEELLATDDELCMWKEKEQ